MHDVMMIQMGARRHYAYTRQLEEAGLLHSFVTDVAWANNHSWMPRLAANIVPKLKPALDRRILQMRDADRLESSILPNVMNVPWPGMGQEQRYENSNDLLGWVAERRWDDNVRVVVNYFGNGGTFLKRAKKRGALIVTDFISHPRYWDIVAKERQLWPGWEASNLVEANRRAYIKRVEYLVSISDIYCCPSTAIAEALADFVDFDKTKVRLLPYGCPPNSHVSTRPQLGRVFCAASAITLAKGIVYLAQAAAIVKTKYRDAEFIVAGNMPEGFRNRPELASLKFLGPIGKDEMAEQFAQADVFCLPTLAEGSATVIFEAMNHGVPCVTTPAAGSIITHGLDGLIVPERDAQATADAISQLIENRSRRKAICLMARQTSQQYSDRECGEAFVEMIAALPRTAVGRR